MYLLNGHDLDEDLPQAERHLGKYAKMIWVTPGERVKIERKYVEDL